MGTEEQGLKRAYRIALICGVIPLVTGISIFVLWLLTRWEWLMQAGLITLYGGCFFFLGGLVALARYAWLGHRVSDLPRSRYRRSVLGSAALLLSNFFVAAGIIASVAVIETRYMVTIRNNSPQTLSQVQVLGGGEEINFGIISPNGIVKRTFWIDREGELKIHAIIGNTKQEQTIDGYVTSGIGGDTVVIINPDSTITSSNHFSGD